MNCQTFEPTVNDLARGQMMEAALRESALAHAEECARCNALLADERALSFSLRAFASASATLEAPAQVETALRAAFRQQGSAKKTAPVVAIVPPRTRHLLPWAVAAAASILAVFALQAFNLRQTHAPLRSASNTRSLSQLSTVALNSGERNLVDAPSKTESDDVTTPSRNASGARGGMLLAGYSPTRNRNSRQSRESLTTGAEQEIVTDFMPLTYGAALSPSDGAQLVRVELPRSALASLGLPMNVERPNERVKADVLLGHDGMARAIRFVR
ncbi:MAG: hypothetical protein ICV68_06355 [Pyrinomonadaceae bacterium]|nr:hypothetical protein [Pyrinomonadaceae bacterium]